MKAAGHQHRDAVAVQIAGSQRVQNLLMDETIHSEIRITVASPGRQCCSNG